MRQFFHICFVTILLLNAKVVTAEVMFDASIWTNQKNTQIRVKTEFMNSISKCQSSMDEMAKSLSSRGYKRVSSDSSTYQNIFTNSLFYTNNNKLFALIQCKEF